MVRSVSFDLWSKFDETVCIKSVNSIHRASATDFKAIITIPQHFFLQKHQLYRESYHYLLLSGKAKIATAFRPNFSFLMFTAVTVQRQGNFCYAF